MRGQAALEFITTYGWAILAVLVVIGGLSYFGVFDFSSQAPAGCTATAGFSCTDVVFTSESGVLTANVSIGGLEDLDITSMEATVGDATLPCVLPPRIRRDAKEVVSCSGPATVKKNAKVTFEGTYIEIDQVYDHSLVIEATSTVKHVTAPGAFCGDSNCDPGEDCTCSDCPCGVDEGCCGAACIDIASDPNNCGGCGTTCGGSYACNAQVCESCGDGVVNGGETCDTNGDVGCAPPSVCQPGCGSCQLPAPTCGNSVCEPGEDCTCSDCACGPGQSCCGAACLDVMSDPNNCGGCGVVCGGSYLCVSGSCETDSDGICNGGETCASHPTECPCGVDEGCCGAACIDVASDPNNCGGCGTACGGSYACNSQTCESCGDGVRNGDEVCDAATNDGCTGLETCTALCDACEGPPTCNLQGGWICDGSSASGISAGNAGTCQFMCEMTPGTVCCEYQGFQDVDCFLFTDGGIQPGGWSAGLCV